LLQNKKINQKNKQLIPRQKQKGKKKKLGLWFQVSTPKTSYVQSKNMLDDALYSPH
jgi:hypothetical protein